VAEAIVAEAIVAEAIVAKARRQQLTVSRHRESLSGVATMECKRRAMRTARLLAFTDLMERSSKAAGSEKQRL
jgi:hypothetical protein